MRRALIAAVIAIICGLSPARAADAAFTQFIASLWPEAQAAGVSRATFDEQTRGLEPDYKLPDLILPGRPATGAPSQAEFVQVPADYVKEASIARLAGEGQRLLQKYRPALSEIEKKSGVPATIMLAIWGRETDYGRYTLPYDLVRVLATQAYVGRRKDTYPQRVHPVAEDPRRGRGDAQGHALVLGGCHRAHAIPAVRILQARRRLRRRRPHRHLAFGAGCAGLGRAAARQQGLAERRALGLRGAGAGQGRLHQRRARGDEADRPVAARRFCAGAWTKAERCRAGAAGLAAAAGRHLRPVVPDARRTTSSSRSTISPISTCCSSAISPTA